MPGPRLAGIVAASVTPVTAEGEIDVARLLRHIDRLHADGCDHVSTFGTTGEGASLSGGQKTAALRAMAEAGADMARQIPAAMTSNVDDAAETMRVAGETGCRAVLVLPPFYYPFWTDAGIVDFVSAAAERAERSAPPVDLLLYDIPQFSRVPYSNALVSMLVERFGDRIVGMKDSTGDRAHGVMLARTFPNLSIFTGDDRVLPDLMAAGGAGIIGGMPNLFARDLRVLVLEPTSEAGRAALARSAARIEAIDGNGGLAAIKALLARYAGDPEMARVLPPLRSPAPGVVDEVARLVAATGFDYATGDVASSL